MKKLLTIITIAFSINAHAQCQTAPCTNVITFPISTNDFNNSSGIYAGYGPNRCIEGQGTFGPNLNTPNNANWWSFNGTGTGIDITQTLNMNTGMKGYFDGRNNVFMLTVAGDIDSTNIYCSENSHTTCASIVCNGFYNYIHLGNGASFFINGTLYQAGDTYQGQGNSTNVIHFVGCSQPLSIVFEKFYFKSGYLYWKVNKEGYKLHMMYSGDGGHTWGIECDPYELEDKYQVKSDGLYRLLIGSDTSDIVPVKWEQILPKEQPKRVELYEIKSLNLKAWKTIR